MIKIGLIIGIAFILSLITATGKTFFDLSKSNIVGGEEGTAADFMKDGEEVVFHEKRDQKRKI